VPAQCFVLFVMNKIRNNHQYERQLINQCQNIMGNPRSHKYPNLDTGRF
jgi:hypothetical protein